MGREQAVGRVWRVAHFVLSDVLDISPEEAVQSRTWRRAPSAGMASGNSCATAREASSVLQREGDVPCCEGGAKALPSMDRSLSRSLSTSWSTLVAEKSVSLDDLQSKPSLNRMVSLSQRGPRFRPELTSVAESRQDADELSDCSSLQSGSTGVPVSVGRNGKHTPRDEGEVGQSSRFSSPFEAVSRGAPLEGFEEDGVHVIPTGVPAAQSSSSLPGSRRLASMQSQSESLMTDQSSALSSILDNASIPSSALSLAAEAEEAFVFPQGSSSDVAVQQHQLQPVLSKHESVSTEASAASSHISISPFYQVQHPECGEEDSSVRGYLSAASSLGDCGLLAPLASTEAVDSPEEVSEVQASAQKEDKRADSTLPARLLSLRAAQHAAQRSSISTAQSGVMNHLKKDQPESGDDVTWSALAGELAVSSLQAASAHESQLDDLALGIPTKQPRSPRAELAPENLLTLEARRSIVFGEKPGEQRPEMGQIVTEMARSVNRLQAMMSLPPQFLQSSVSNIIPHRLQVRCRFTNDAWFAVGWYEYFVI